ncbi:MAG: MFS transporter [Chloroflexota bacterium]
MSIALLIFVSLGFSGGLLNIAWTYMRVSFSVDLDQLGILLLCATVGSLIAAFGSGALVGRWGIGIVAVGGALLTMLGLLAIGLSPAWTALLGAIFVMYLGRGALDAGMNNFVSENFDSWAMNVLHASWGLGLTIAPGILTVLLVRGEANWRTGYLLLAGLFAILIVLVAVHVNDWESSSTNDHKPYSRHPMRESLTDSRVWVGIIVFFIYGGLEIGIGQLANTLLVESRGASQPVASFWLSAYWGSFTIGRLLIGVIALRIADARIIWGGLAMALAGAACIAVPGSLSLNLLGLMLCGAGLAGFFPLLISNTPRRVGRENSANAIGFQVGSAGLGAALLPGGIGIIADNLGLEFIALGLLTNALVLLMVYVGMIAYDSHINPRAKA